MAPDADACGAGGACTHRWWHWKSAAPAGGCGYARARGRTRPRHRVAPSARGAPRVLRWRVANRLRSLWQRIRTWWAVRLGVWRGRWQTQHVEVEVARWGWWAWPWASRRWAFSLYRPAGLPDEQAAPLIIVLHGCRQRAIAFAQASGWVAAADSSRMRLLCPQQRPGASLYRCWNWFHPAAQGGRGELDVVLQALRVVCDQVACRRVAVVGLSAGGGLAALLAFHGAEHVDAVVAVAAPPLMGSAFVQDPRQLMRDGLSIRPSVAVMPRRRCAPLLVLHGAADAVVNPVCAEQLAEQARSVLAREPGVLSSQTRDAGTDWRIDGHLRLRLVLLPVLGHVWSGAPGGHDHVESEGPPLTDLALDFLRRVGVLDAA